MLTTPIGDWSDNFQKGVGSNKNLNRCGLALGLERFIYGGNKGKKVADTIEAILGAIYLDSGSSMAKCKDVMDALELFPQKQRLEREYDIEGLIFLDDHSLQPLLAKKGPSSFFKEMGPVVLEDPGIQPLQPKERPNPTF